MVVVVVVVLWKECVVVVERVRLVQFAGLNARTTRSASCDSRPEDAGRSGLGAALRRRSLERWRRAASRRRSIACWLASNMAIWGLGCIATSLWCGICPGLA